jgi:hypothetical protein
MEALNVNTIGSNNTGSGSDSLSFNTTGNDNTAIGYTALTINTTGNYATAVGSGALFYNSTGTNNTAFGYMALHSNTTGSNNLVAGYKAGINLTNGSNNIDIGNQGASGDNNTIKIGIQGTQTLTQIAGIYGNILDRGLLVLIDSSGRLGTSSFEHLKTLLGEREIERKAMKEKLDVLTTQSENQLTEIRDLKKMIFEMQAGLVKLQAEDTLVAQR